MRFILTRHYQTESNAEGRILGWGDSPPCPGWKSHVDFIANRLNKAGVSFDAVYSSDLKRARKTAKVYADSFGISDFNEAPELKEINYGDLQTRKKDWVSKHYPQHKKDADLVYPNGESFRQMQQRSTRFLHSLALSRPQQTLLIVSHAGVIRGIISHFLGLEFDSSLKHRISFRYIGDFLFEGENCVRYDEPGKASGFVRDHIIEVPAKPGSVG